MKFKGRKFVRFDKFEKSSNKNGFEFDLDQFGKNNKVHTLVTASKNFDVLPILTYNT